MPTIHEAAHARVRPGVGGAGAHAWSASNPGNPIGGEPPLGASASGTSHNGGGSVGGQDPPNAAARSGVGSGKGVSTSCMTSAELNANLGLAVKPGAIAQAAEGIGLPSECADPCTCAVKG